MSRKMRTARGQDQDVCLCGSGHKVDLAAIRENYLALNSELRQSVKEELLKQAALALARERVGCEQVELNYVQPTCGGRDRQSQERCE